MRAVADTLRQFGLDGNKFSVEPVGSGHIHDTYLVRNADDAYIVQRVNKHVFTKPDVIAANLRTAADYLKKNYPEYRFITPLQTVGGAEMYYDAERFPWRLFPYISNSYTVDRADTVAQALNASAAFGKLGRYLGKADVSKFGYTIDRFHDLKWRFEQFQQALQNPAPGRLAEAKEAVASALRAQSLVTAFSNLISGGELQLRITHNDTKINNVLFDRTTQQAIAAIDLDTLMPGYFIYDLGDMIRTFVSPVDEEERNVALVRVRKEFYDAVVEGYLSEMSSSLTPEEKAQIPFAGLMMTYIMALRMLTDFLNGDVYYKIKYADQNLVRATNQLKLLHELAVFLGWTF